jgi:nucleoside-diphosphate-sugar epimerase
MVVLVTGVTGFLGGVHLQRLIQEEKIAAKDIRVLVMEHEEKTAFEKMGVDIFVGNLLYPETLKGIMKDVTEAYHNAAIIINEAADRETIMKVNYKGTVKLADEFLKEEATRKFVYASPFGVYGMKLPKYPVKEDHRISPANNYQESKYLAEKYLLETAKEQGMNATAIRNSLILGPGDKVTSFRLAKGLLEGKVFYLGHGRYQSSYIDARDSSRAMILATKSKQAKGEAYNVKSFDISQKDYFDCYAKACGGCYPVKKYPKAIAYLYAWYKELTTPKGQETLVSRKELIGTPIIDWLIYQK